MKKQQVVEHVNTAWMLPGVKCWVQIATEDSDVFPDLFAPATIQEINDTKVSVTYSEHEQLPPVVDTNKIFQVNIMEDPQGYTDMVVMEALNEAEILANLKHRYSQNLIFTYIGPTLMAMNPYKSMESQLGPDVLKIYQEQSTSLNSFNLRDTPPHTYAIAANAYRKMLENTKNQAIVISGESGAGKTENAKIAMRFLTSLSEAGTQVIDTSERIEEKIMACNPILESFGNAKTVRNDNSSRFGKYVRIIVNSESRRIKGAAINNYLLEKSRVVGPGPQERNYHVFYNILKGASKETLEQLFLVKDGVPIKAEELEYLRLGECVEVAAINDVKWYEELMESFKHIQFSQQELDTVLQSLSAIMLLGNLKFDTSTLTDKNPCGFADQTLFQNISQLLNIPIEEMRKSLTIKTREVGKTIIESPLNEADAISNKNALAANLYDRIFSWLVKRLNTTIIPKEDLHIEGNIRKSIKMIKRQSILGTKLSIGLLDIFGFENFKHNSFEQFCINYTNEKLQQLYISYVFKSEEQEFVNEGLKDHLSQLNYSDNGAVIELMDKQAVGIFDMIDEITQLGSGTDEALYQKIIKTQKDHKNLSVPKIAKDKFSIVHTAKTVEYTIGGFRGKNKSEISGDLVKGVMSSTNKLLHHIFLVLCGKEVDNLAEELEKMKKPTKFDKFLGAKFRQQMKSLMDELGSSDCHFVRCLKPNEIKKPNVVTASYTLLQIKYLGVLESIKVRKDGFPFRKDYKQFYQQFHETSKKYRHTSIFKQNGDFQQICTEIVKELIPEALILAGKTKFFAKDKVGRQLDEALASWHKHKQLQARKIQRCFKTLVFKKKFSKYLHDLVLKIRKFYVIMAHFRRRRQRKIFLRKKEAIKRANAIYWQIALRSALNLYQKKVRSVIKWECQQNSLQQLIVTLAKVKQRRALSKYRLQQLKKAKITGIKNILKNRGNFKSRILKKYISRYSSQVKLKFKQLEEARLAELARLEQIRLAELAAIEAARLAALEAARIEEENRIAEQKRLEEKKRQEEEDRKREEARLAMIKQGQLAEAERLEREQKAIEEARKVKEAEDAKKAKDAEDARKIKEAEDARKAKEVEVQRQKLAQQENERKLQEQQQAEKAQREEQEKLIETQSSVAKSQAIIAASTEINSQGSINKRDTSPQKQSEIISHQSVEKKIDSTQNNNHIELEQPKVQHEQPNNKHIEDESPRRKNDSMLNSTDSATNKERSSTNLKYGDKTVVLQYQPDVEEEEPPNEPQASERNERLTSTYMDDDFFEKAKDPKGAEERQMMVQQSALRKQLSKEGPDDDDARRKRITVSKNILPFIPKDKSDLEKFLVDRSHYKINHPQFADVPTSQDFALSLEKIDKTFMKKVASSHFLDFCSTVLRKRKKMFSDLPSDKIMVWSNQPLDKSLTHIPATLEASVKHITQLVYQFSGEMKAQNSDPSVICEDLIKQVFNNPQLIDEVYLLVLKQIIMNKTSTQLKYCQLLVGLSSSVAPSPKALFPIMNFLEIGARAFQKREIIQLNPARIPLFIGVQGEEVSELLKFAFLRLMKTFSRGRVYNPNAQELQLTFAYRQLLVPVYIYQGNVDYMFIEPHFTERQLVELIVKKYRMYPVWENLGLCRCTGYCENFLEENCLVVDALREIEEIAKDIKLNRSKQPLPYLGLRIKVFFVFQPQDLDSLCLYFMQFANEYMKGNYALTHEKAALLGVLKLISEHGCLQKNFGKIPTFHPAHYIPFPLLEGKDWSAILVDKYQKFPTLDEMHARGRFLEEIRTFVQISQQLKPTFMTWQYPCTYSTGREQPKSIILAVRPFQIYICDVEHREIKLRYHFLQVILWGQQKDVVSIETEDGLAHKLRMTRGQDDAVGFNSLMKTYMDRALLQQEGV